MIRSKTKLHRMQCNWTVAKVASVTETVLALQ